VLPISRPSEGSSGETGLWRIFAPRINYEKCVKCFRCWLLCPEAAIRDLGDRPEIDYRYCKGCGVCAKECPVGAIEMVREGG